MAQSRQIRALFDEDTITVYQAYSSTIASAAVAAQKLDASPDFKPDRMTWIKPSWCWMMYRSGYSYKDARQERILALKMTHATFLHLLESAVLAEESQKADVVVQWDPERNHRLEKLSGGGEVRSIQIGVGRRSGRWWIEEGIVAIEDVTARAREMKRMLEADLEKSLSLEEMQKLGLVPEERVFEVTEEVKQKLQMR